ncbi:MAG: AIR synthase-related protein, partial [Planctomycetales bacterium]|nr:AIR synthase-related protein [Planctomycetales bacterium]
GVRDYGNRMGIPTAAGGLLVHPGYLGSPLVFAGCVGVLPVSAVGKEVRPGDRIVLAGGRTGRDGIHGATFSSEALSADSERISATAVQIGNAIEEKRLVEGVLRVRDLGALRAITDCGAGGLSSAVGEMGEGTGAEVELSQVPQKYEGLSPAEVWVSEAQERMVLAVPPDRLEEALRALAEEEVEATAIGRFTSDRRLRVLWHGRPVADLPMEFLHHGLPRAPREARWSPPPAAEPRAGPAADAGAEILAMLSDWNVCSREWIVRQYDHEVQGGTVGKPFVGARAEGPGDGCMVRPDPRSFRGIALAHGGNPRHGELDPHAMAVGAVDEALRNLAAMGADLATVALLDNFVWGDTDDPEVLGGLARACLGCRDAALAYGAPFVSGKDSLHNTYVAPDGRRLSVPGTLLVTALAVVPDVRRLVTSDLKRPGDALYLVGVTRDELGGSLFRARRGETGANVPRPDPERGRRALSAVSSATARGLVRAAHDPSEGGLGVALAEMCLGGDLGATVSLAALPRAAADAAWSPTDAALLFSESASRLLCEVPPGDAAAFERLCEEAGAPAARIGAVEASPRLVVRGLSGATAADLPVDELRRAFREPLYRVMGEKTP